MSKITENRINLAQMPVSEIDCVKLAHAGHKRLMLVACLSNGTRLQLSTPQFEFLIKDGIARHYVSRYLPAISKRQFESIANGNVCINKMNIKSFGIENFGHTGRVNIIANFESGNEIRLYSISSEMQRHEKSKLSQQFFVGEMK